MMSHFMQQVHVFFHLCLVFFFGTTKFIVYNYHLFSVGHDTVWASFFDLICQGIDFQNTAFVEKTPPFGEP